MNTYVASSIILMVGLIFIRVIVNALHYSKKQLKALVNLFSGVFILIMVLGTVSYVLADKDERKKHNKSLSFSEFINGGKLDATFVKRILVGLVSGVVFGILDNGGLWFGMDALDPILPKNKLVAAGYGNVFADSVSAFSATFAGNIITSVTNVKGDTPIWADGLGTFMGCLIGLHVCRFITGRG